MSKAKYLNEAEGRALAEIKQRVSARYDVRRFILFGSKARGDFEPCSDVDLLIVTQRDVSHRERHEISDIITQVNLEHDTLFSSVVIPAKKWDSKLYSFYPIHATVAREGITV